MRRVIGMDIHRTFAEVVFWEAGRLRPAGRVDMTRSGLEGFGRTLSKEDEVVVEATGNAMAVVRVLEPYVARVIVANPLQVKAIAHAHVKTDKIDAGVLASLRAAGFLPEVWLPDADTERLRRLVARRNQVVRHRTRIKNEVHAILQAHLVPPLPACRPVRPAGSELARSDRCCRTMSAPPSSGICASSTGSARISSVLDREIAQAVIERSGGQAPADHHRREPHRRRGLGRRDRRRAPLLPAPQKFVSYVGLNPRVRQSGLGLAQHGRISKRGRSHARAMLVEAAWAAAKAPGPLRSFFLRIRARRGHQVAAVAVARKLAVLCWHLLTKDADYQWARPALVAEQGTRDGAAGGTTGEKGQQARRGLRLQRQGAARSGDRRRPTRRTGLRTVRPRMAATRPGKAAHGRRQ